MNCRIFIYTFFLSVCTSGYLQSQKLIDNFTLKDSRDDKNFSLSQGSNSKGVVVIFNSTSCPYSIHYDSRIRKLKEGYSEKGILFLMINSNFKKKESAESLEESKSKGIALGIPFLIDDRQEVLRMFGAEKNPESFLLKPENGKFRIVYQGAIDDNPQVETDVHSFYLQNAIEQLLQNKKINPSIVNPTGCVIKR